jgi:hypothetical protein
MKKYLAALLLAVPFAARASDCFQDPIYEHNWTATVTTGARLRDVACMTGSTVLTTLAVGSKVSLIGETDGWYKVRSNGLEGWVGQQLVSVSQEPYVAPVISPEPTPTVIASPAPSRLRGYILLQVEQHGEAWYVQPTDGARYYMKDGPTAYQMMRKFGLGMTETDYARLAAGNTTLISRLRGRIVLRVQAHGEAYYIHPNGTVQYLRDGQAAYDVMRGMSLGISDRDLAAITEKQLP